MTEVKWYKAYLIQDGQGCDYTIGCGQTIIELEALDMDEAKLKLIDIILEEYNHDEYRLESAELFEISEIYHIPIDDIYDENEREVQIILDQEEEKEELKEYERLRGKYGTDSSNNLSGNTGAP